MTEASVDRNLLFGVLAVQLDFVSRDDLFAAASQWVHDKLQPLSEVFIEQRMISPEESKLIDGIVKKHLQRNGGDLRVSLHSIEAFEAIRSTLSDFDDAELRATLEPEVHEAPKADPYRTQASIPREATDSKTRYSILRLHQKGGLGRVSIALDEELHREIALKEILPAQADNEENRTRFVREAEITGALEHPGVVPVYSLGQFADGRPFYAMRFIRGMNLQIATNDYHHNRGDKALKPLLFRQLLGRFVDVCYAMEYAHSRSIIHRDLKPDNIMLGDYGETLVVDWGLAKSLGDGFATDVSTVPPVHPTKLPDSTETQVGRVVGTPSYMSPEQAAGRLDALGPCSDIYSLGATLYHLLTGKPPFSGSEEEVLGNVILGRFDRPRAVNPEVPRAMEAICLKAMARLPDHRYSTGRELAEDIERFLADERVQSYAEPFPVKAWRWVRNHRPLVISTAAALTVAVTALSITVVMLSAANVRVVASRDAARLSYEEAERQRTLAENTLGLARDTVREYCVLVSEETLLKQPGMHRLREELLQKGLDYYQQFLSERKDNPALREEVAQAHFLVGKLTQAIESPAAALPHYEEAVALQEKLLNESDQGLELRANFGTTLNAIGDALLRLGDIEGAQNRFEQAVEVRKELAKDDPENVEAARTLANSLMNIGFVHYLNRDIDAAISLLEHAQTIRIARLGIDNHEYPKLQSDLGKGHYLLAVAFKDRGNLVDAESHFLSAVNLFSKLLKASPSQLTYKRNLAACHRMLGDLWVLRNSRDQAIESYETAREALEELQTRNPDVLEYSSNLSGVYMNLGLQLKRRGDVEKALQYMEQAVELLRELTEQAAQVPNYRLDLGVALREVGNMLANAGEIELAGDRLQESKSALSKLVSDDPVNEKYSTELGLTIDAIAGLKPAKIEN